MKQNFLTFLLAGLLLASCGGKDKKDETKPDTSTGGDGTTLKNAEELPALGTDSASQAAMMKAWQDYATPGPEHAWMAESAGTWVCDSVKQWMDPSQPPSYSSATDVVTMAMNGLYQMTDFSSQMMGMPMQGHGIMGYDKVKKKFVLSWIDNLGSGIVQMQGDYNKDTKTLNMSGKQSDPGRGMDSDIRQELVFHADGSYTMSMYGTGHDGKSEEKFMEGTFRRKK